MSVSVKIELGRRNTKNNGKLSLKLLIVVNRNPLRISLGYSLHPKDWNKKLQIVRASCTDFENICNLMDPFIECLENLIERTGFLIKSG